MLRQNQCTKSAKKIDLIGNLNHDKSEEIETIEWTVYGKVSKVLRTNISTKPELEYLYDAMGNRIVKIVKHRYPDDINVTDGPSHLSAPAEWDYTYYSRDASGNILATYSDNADESSPNQTEYNIYGSSRLGTQTFSPSALSEYSYKNTIETFTEDVKIQQNQINTINDLPFVNGNFSYNIQVGDRITLFSGQTYTINSIISTGSSNGDVVTKCNVSYTAGMMNLFSNNTKGRKSYELSNHLGNVMVTVSDKRLGQDLNNDNKADFYFADVTSATDYYPFGSVIQGRTYTPSNAYRFGYNGQEKENDITDVEGGHLAFKLRIYDSRLGKFLSIDPLTKDFPNQSPYVYCENSPISLKELEGAEGMPGFFMGGGLEWLSQGVANAVKAKNEGVNFSIHMLSKAFVTDIDFVDVGFSAGQGFFTPGGAGKALTKISVTIIGELAKGKFSGSIGDGLSVNNNETMFREAAIGSAGAGFGGAMSTKLFKDSRGMAVKAAENFFNKSNKKFSEKVVAGTQASATKWTKETVDNATQDLIYKKGLNKYLGNASSDAISTPIDAVMGTSGEILENITEPVSDPAVEQESVKALSSTITNVSRFYLNGTQRSITVDYSDGDQKIFYNQKTESGKYTNVFTTDKPLERK